MSCSNEKRKRKSQLWGKWANSVFRVLLTCSWPLPASPQGSTRHAKRPDFIFQCQRGLNRFLSPSFFFRLRVEGNLLHGWLWKSVSNLSNETRCKWSHVNSPAGAANTYKPTQPPLGEQRSRVDKGSIYHFRMAPCPHCSPQLLSTSHRMLTASLGLFWKTKRH